MNCHFQGYLPAALCDEKIQDLILPLVGAKAGEVALMNSLRPGSIPGQIPSLRNNHP